MNEPVKFLKTDVMGRVRTPRGRREALLEEFEKSGSSAAQFAGLVGVKYPTFASWVQQRRRERGGGRAAGRQSPVKAVGALQWVEATVEAAGTSGRMGGVLVVEWPCGARLQVRDAAQATLAAELLRAWAGPQGAVRC